MPELLLENGVPARVELEFDVDPLDAAGVVLANFIGLVPGVGVLLTTLVTIFWPKHSVDVWAQIKQEVKSLVDEEIDESEWAMLQGRSPNVGTRSENFAMFLKLEIRNTLKHYIKSLRDILSDWKKTLK